MIGREGENGNCIYNYIGYIYIIMYIMYCVYIYEKYIHSWNFEISKCEIVLSEI